MFHVEHFVITVVYVHHSDREETPFSFKEIPAPASDSATVGQPWLAPTPRLGFEVHSWAEGWAVTQIP